VGYGRDHPARKFYPLAFARKNPGCHRAGLKTVLCRKNENLVDVPKKVLTDLKIVPINHMDEVLKIALHTTPTNTGPRHKVLEKADKDARKEEEKD